MELGTGDDGHDGLPRLVVAMGASAGGLAPLQEFFEATPPDTGFAYVIAQHLSPDHATVMDSLLARNTAMPVLTAEDDMVLRADHVYLLPPKAELRVGQESLEVSEQVRLPGVPPHPIDICFESVAATWGPRAAAVVLSGTGDDGTAGIQAVRSAGGFTIVQDSSARFASMPGSADRTGAVDQILAPVAMPEAIARFSADPDLARIPVANDAYGEYSRIIAALSNAYGLDFNAYKIGTVRRRIERRIEMSGSVDVAAYTRLVESDESELRTLYDDLLIGVTAFFRDPSVWEHLQATIIPTIVAEAQNEEREIRVWVAGCAMGHEAYSYAMLLLEQLDAEDIDLPVRIFATDADQRSLATASAGLYGADTVAEVPTALLEKYFTSEGDDYRVNQRLRRCVTFSAHNVLRDAPFTRIDLLSCRNLLIYLRSEAQHQALRYFHFSLRVDGMMVLGLSESIDFLEEEFEEIGGSDNIFRKVRNTRFVATAPGHARRVPRPVPAANRGAVNDRLLKAYDELLDEYAPPAFLVDENRHLLHTFGAAASLLHQPTGRTRLDLLDLLDDSLRVPLWGALQRTLSTNEPVRLDGLLVTGDDPYGLTSIEVKPITRRDGSGPAALIVITPHRDDTLARTDQGAAIRPRLRGPAEANQLEEQAQLDIAVLERELQITRESLQTTIEELEASNEELIASNEELQSTNEELQSVNEELHTVNSEHEAKIAELSQLTADMDNLLASTEIGTLFLDRELNIRRYTPALADYVKLRPQDVGRPVGDIVLTLDLPSLQDDATEVIHTGASIEREARSDDAGWILVRMTPYRVAGGQIEGVVVSVIDIASLRHAQLHLDAVTRRFEAFMRHSPALKWALDADGRYVFVNDEYAARLGVDADEVIGAAPAEMLTPEIDAALHSRIGSMLDAGAEHTDERFELQVPSHGGVLHLLTNVFGYDDADGPVMGGSALDITDLRSAEAGIERHRGQLRHVLDRIPARVWLIDDERRVLLVNEAALRELGRTASDVLGRTVDDVHGHEAEMLFGPVGGADRLTDGTRLTDPDLNSGAVFRVETIRLDGDNADSHETIVMATDVSDLVRVQSELALMNTELARRNAELDQFAHLASHDLRAPLRAIHAFGQMAVDQTGPSENLARVLAGVERMRRMLDSLLAYAESGRQTLAVVETDLDAVLGAAIEDLSADIAASGALIDAEELPRISCDPVQFRGLFQNLLQNAIQYAGDDPPHVEITSSIDGDTVAIEFRDHGVGFEQDQAAEVFEPFRRLAPSSSGQGIGLAICRRVVERHGGKIWARSEPGKGAQFSLRIPTTPPPGSPDA
ncbi:MAG: CheR family methyltransferase [Actinomycetota bacterium]